jgi:hypothetical protein
MRTMVGLVALLVSCGKSEAVKEREARAKEESQVAEAYLDALNAREELAERERQMAPVQPVATETQPEIPWTYSETLDKMRGTTLKLARVRSTNAFAISFPEPGKAHLELVVREKEGEHDVILAITEGMLDPCAPICTVHAKFDDGAVQSFKAIGSQDLSRPTTFIDNAPRWLKQLKPAKHATIEVTLFDGARKQFEFNVQGIEWPRPTAGATDNRANQKPGRTSATP